jgi:T-complex protein 1 subunit delta
VLLLQDVVAGDGTTSVVVICGALLKKCQELLERGVHPTVISDSFNKAAQKACQVGSRGWPELPESPMVLSVIRSNSLNGQLCHSQILESIAIPVNLDDRESLLRAATT